MIVFTARCGCRPSSVLYIRATVTFRGGRRTRRWQVAIAIVAALTLFAAVTTGWAARGSAYASSALWQPATVSHQASHVGVQVDHLQRADHAPPIDQFAHSSSSNSPTHQKPTKNAWMTRDRPPTWTPLSPQSVLSPLPVSFAAQGLSPDVAHAVVPTADRSGQDILAEFCVARR